MIIALVSCYCSNFTLHQTKANHVIQTVAFVRGDSTVKGVVKFEQADENSPTTVSWDISGNDANAERGMHVHVYGDNTNGCTSAGGHCK